MDTEAENRKNLEQPTTEVAERAFAHTAESEKKWYVYLLCDPDTQQPFYVGKGTGDRIDQHEKDLDEKFLGNPAKKWIIRNILAQGKQILKQKVAKFNSEQEAYAHERELIALYGPCLTNIMPGYEGFRENTERLEKKMQNIQNTVPLEQEMITFQGKPLAIVRLPDSKVYAILRWICEKMHIDVNGQAQRIKRNPVIAENLIYACVLTEGGPQTMPLLALKSIPYWLATIDTRRMSKEDGRQQELLEYQRSALLALYDAFTFPFQH